MLFIQHEYIHIKEIMYKAEKKYLQKEIHQNINSGDLWVVGLEVMFSLLWLSFIFQI